MADTVGARLANYGFQEQLKKYQEKKVKPVKSETSGLLQRTTKVDNGQQEDTFLFDLALSIRNGDKNA